MDKKTKIIATIGPATCTEEKILELYHNGMNVARLNFSHDTHENHKKRIDVIRKIEKEKNLPIAIIQDLQGPKIRLGNLTEEPVRLERNQVVKLFHGKEQIDDRIPVQIDIFPYIHVGSHILVNDGIIRLRVDSLEAHDATCTVLAGGEIKSHKGVNLPDTQLPNMSLTEKDKIDLAFGLEQKVDFVAISFVQTEDDVTYLKSLIAANPHHPKVIVKLETAAAVKHLEAIILATDVIMVARGDLAVEVGQEEVPLIQRRIVSLARKYNKPVIVATQMLESMIVNAEPTRAEVNDIATAVLDQVDAVMLSAETTTGNYPVEAVAMMNKVIRRVERYHEEEEPKYSINAIKDASTQTASIAAVACVLAHQLKAKELLVLTSSGGTALCLAANRPPISISAITDDPLVYKQLILAWGITCYYVRKFEDNEATFKHLIAILQEQNKIKQGDTIVKVAGAYPGKAGYTNEISVFQVGEEK